MACNDKDSILYLMKEININSKIKNELLQCVNNKKPFPFKPKNLFHLNKHENKTDEPKRLKLPPKPMQRSKVTIEKSGSYEVDKYHPNHSKIRPPEEKERFQNIMAFGQDLSNKEKNSSNIKTGNFEEPQDLFDLIVSEIKERKDFLNEMYEIGYGKKYLHEIQCQISLRLKELEKIDKNRVQEVILKYDL